MKFIRTHDGKFGWEKEGKRRWMETEYQAKIYGAALLDYEPDEVPGFIKEFDKMMDDLIKTGNTVGHFGIFGTFMYSEREYA